MPPTIYAIRCCSIPQSLHSDAIPTEAKDIRRPQYYNLEAKAKGEPRKMEELTMETHAPPIERKRHGPQNPDPSKREVASHIKTIIPPHSSHNHKPKPHADDCTSKPVSTRDTRPQEVTGRDEVIPLIPFWFRCLITERPGPCLYRYTNRYEQHQTPPPPCLDGTTKTCGGNVADHWGTLQSWPMGHSCVRGMGRPMGP